MGAISLEELKEKITIDDVYNLLESLSAEPIKRNGILICRTVCHNSEEHINTASHKLYYYENTKLFKCYTDCENNVFDIVDLIIKINKNKKIDITLYQAISYIINFFHLEGFDFSSNNIENSLEDWKILNKYQQNNSQEEQEKKIIDLKFYDDKILKYLPRPKLPMWLNEGITQEVMDNVGIAFDPASWGIVIPHRDPAGQLLGIRERTLIKEEEENGKYKPAVLNYQMYNHPLSYNLYNLNNSKDNIRKMKKAIVFEGEKSCLLYASYFGIENDISVAVCGSNLTQYQVSLLLELGVQEIAIAFDKQFKNIGDEEWKKWTNKLKEINKKYGAIVNLSFIFDKWNLLGYKSSPIDEGKDKFLELFKKRVTL